MLEVKDVGQMLAVTLTFHIDEFFMTIKQQL